MSQPGHEAGGLQMDRRSVLRTGTAVAGVAAAGGLALSSTPAHAQGLTDTQILQFLSNFEYVGANYYLYGLTGQGIPASLTTGQGTQGPVLAGGPVPFSSPAIQQYVQRLAVDELAHLQFFRTVLGANAIAQPTVDIAGSWTAMAIAAGLIVPGQTFNPYSGDVAFLLGAYVLEDVCVTTAAGLGRYITDKNNLEAAAGILAVEGYHAGAIRTLLSNLGAGVATDAISALRARLSGAADDQGTSIPGQAYNFSNTDSNALVFRRSPAQTLAVVYGGGTGGGGFFPNGLNGPIR